MNPRTLRHGIFLCLLLVLSVYIFQAYDRNVPVQFVPIAHYLNPELIGESAYVVDLKTGEILFAKHEKKEHPIASITKIMTTLVAKDIYTDGNTILSIPEKSLEEDGDSGLLANEKWKIDQLLAFMLVVSSNDAAKAIELEAEKNNGDTFINRMNLKVLELGLEHTYFYNDSGLDREDFVGAYSTAEDVARLAAYAYKKYPNIFAYTGTAETTFVSESAISHIASNTNILTTDMTDIVFSKTGLTDNAGGALVVIIDDGVHDPFAAVVLGSTYEGRFGDMRILIEQTKLFLDGQM